MSRVLLVSLALCAFLVGCASVDFERSVERTNARAVDFTDGKLVLGVNASQRDVMSRRARELLATEVRERDAVELALVTSPALQALLARNWAYAADAAQSGRLPNPVLTFERLRVADEVEFGRLLSIGLLDLLLYPWRLGVAKARLAAEELTLTREVVLQITDVRAAWIRAVAAQERLGYARQVYVAAEVAAELARRMYEAGNFNTVQRAEQHVFYADAATQLALATHEAVATRETLIRALGLDDVQAAQLRVPLRLPDLPGLRGPEEVSEAARSGNLDLQLAQARFVTAAKTQGLGDVASLGDVEVGLRHDTIFDNAASDSVTGRGYELDLVLPLFDWGGVQREAMNARTLAAGYEVEAVLREAGSRLRATYSAYRTAHDIARHYREEILPLRRVLAEENVLRYNAMLIGVFDLLADAREQTRVVIAAIEAMEQFWLTDVALRAALMGAGSETALAGPRVAAEAAQNGH